VDGAGFRPTHVAPAAGLLTWDAPDPSRAATNRLEPDLPVQLLEETTGWARVRCSNGWETWVDAGQLARIPFRPTRAVPSTGLDARAMPDANRPADARLDPGLQVEVVDEWQGWAHVKCDNDWETWVDGRALVPLTAPTTAPSLAGMAVAVALPAALAIVASLLPWFSSPFGDANAWDIKLVSLFTHDSTDIDLKTGPVLLVLALIALALIAVRMAPFASILAFATVGALVFLLGAAGLWLYFDSPDPRPELGIGLLLTFGSGMALAVAGYVAPALRPRPAT
jgi:SH3-like domain-containing protein